MKLRWMDRPRARVNNGADYLKCDGKFDGEIFLYCLWLAPDYMRSGRLHQDRLPGDSKPDVPDRLPDQAKYFIFISREIPSRRSLLPFSSGTRQ